MNNREGKKIAIVKLPVRQSPWDKWNNAASYRLPTAVSVEMPSVWILSKVAEPCNWKYWQEKASKVLVW